MAVLPERTKGRRPIPNAHRPDARLERDAERSIIVPNEILRRRIPRKRLGDLLRQPLSCRMASHRKPQQLPALVAENNQCKELLKRNRWNDEQIKRRNALGIL